MATSVRESALRVTEASRTIRRAETLRIRTLRSAPGYNYPGASLDTRTVARLARYCVGAVLQCNPFLLHGVERGTRKAAFARQLAIHLTHIVGGRRHEEVARAFRLNRSTASHHFEVLENLRDKEPFDAFMSALEERFAHMLRYAETRPWKLWGPALESLALSVRLGELDAEIHYDAKYIVETFKVRRGKRAPA